MGAEHPTPLPGAPHTRPAEIPPRGTQRGVDFLLPDDSGERGAQVQPPPHPTYAPRVPSPGRWVTQGPSRHAVTANVCRLALYFLILKKINKLFYYLFLLSFNYFSPHPE